jgi:hypothetical protein
VAVVVAVEPQAVVEAVAIRHYKRQQLQALETLRL